MGAAKGCCTVGFRSGLWPQWVKNGRFAKIRTMSAYRSRTDIRKSVGRVRFVPKAAVSKRSKGVTEGCVIYSITSSALASSIGGTVTPRQKRWG